MLVKNRARLDELRAPRRVARSDPLAVVLCDPRRTDALRTDHHRARQDGRRPVPPWPADPRATVVSMVAEGITTDAILEAYPDLERDDVREALEYAAEAVRERELPLRRSA